MTSSDLLADFELAGHDDRQACPGGEWVAARFPAVIVDGRTVYDLTARAR